MQTTGLLILVKVLTFNIWGLPDLGPRILSPLRTERIQAICQLLQRASLDSNGWDVILIQEAWTSTDRERLKRCGYEFSADRDQTNTLLDSGLLILSKFPLERIDRLTFSQNGDRARILEDGEAAARKSVLVARVTLPNGRHFWVGNTHLISWYSETPSTDSYLSRRRDQFQQAIRFSLEKAGNEPLIFGGDLNFGTGSPLWNELPQLAPGFSFPPNHESFCTVCPPNQNHLRNEGKIDHLLAGPGVTAVSGRIEMNTPIRIDGQAIDLSDHYGWEAIFQFPSPQGST